MKKAFAIASLLIILCAFICTGSFGTAQNGINVSGILTTDTTWTKTNSPYTLSGPFGVGTGVTLTIEAGTEINLNGFFIAVNGTLNARGSNSEQIHFSNVGSSYPYYGITFTELANSDCIIENSVITSTPNAYYTIYINNTFTTLNSNTIDGKIAILKGSSIISNNQITGSISVHGSPQIVNNFIIAHTYGIENRGESSTVIRNNTIQGESKSNGYGVGGGEGHISDNVIFGFESGISKVAGTIEINLISNNYFGIDAEASGIIQNNTIIDNVEGIFMGAWSPTVIYNNMQNNTHNIYLNAYSKFNFTAINNWWGTTDPQAIKQTIHDNWEGFDFFTVNFAPFLTGTEP
jgi:hypothetical protein